MINDWNVYSSKKHKLKERKDEIFLIGNLSKSSQCFEESICNPQIWKCYYLWPSSVSNYLIIPPLMMPQWGSFQHLKRSWISSSRWGWAHTNPAYFVTSGQSWDATTWITIVRVDWELGQLWVIGVWKCLQQQWMDKCARKDRDELHQLQKLLLERH